MRSPTQYVRVIGATALFPAGAAPRELSGAAIPTRNVEVGSLSTLVAPALTTNLITATAKWQVSDDATTWYDVSSLNNAANVAVATGTGAPVTTSKVLEAPAGVYSWNFARITMVTGAAAADGVADGSAISYRYLKDRW